MFARSHVGAAEVAATGATLGAVAAAVTGVEIASAAGRIAKWSPPPNDCVTARTPPAKNADVIIHRVIASRCKVSAWRID
jgi:Na+/glutamate symporter